MARFLANENVPREAVQAAREAGFDVTWMVELQPGAADETVLALAQREGRVLITLDKDFGELVFRHGRSGSHGVILLRPSPHSPEIVSAFVLMVPNGGRVLSKESGTVIGKLRRKGEEFS